LVAAIATEATKQVARKALGMKTLQNQPGRVRLPNDDCQVLAAAVGRTESDDTRILGVADRNSRLGYFGEIAIRGAFELEHVARIDTQEIVAVRPGDRIADVGDWSDDRRRQQAGDFRQDDGGSGAVVARLFANGNG